MYLSDMPEGQGATRSSAWAGSPTTRRWTTSCSRCSAAPTSGVNQCRPSTATRRSTSCASRRGHDRRDAAPEPLRSRPMKIILNDAPVIPLYFVPRLPRHQQPGRRTSSHDPLCEIDMWTLWIARLEAPLLPRRDVSCTRRCEPVHCRAVGGGLPLETAANRPLLSRIVDHALHGAAAAAEAASLQIRCTTEMR